MTLFIATLLVGLALTVKGIILLSNPDWGRQGNDKILRSHTAGYIIFGLAGAWFLWHITQLGEADFGEYKQWLFILFTAVIIGAFKYLKDFLFVRGWAVLVLLLAKVFLDAAYMQEPWTRLFLVGFIYALILMALYFGTVPYKMRDLTNWFFAYRKRVQGIAIGCIAYGVLLTTVAFFY